MKRLLILALLTASAFGQVTADFGSRSTGAVIPSSWQGSNTIVHLDSNSIAQTVNAGIKVSREFGIMSTVWANCPSPCTPNYFSTDQITTAAANGGYKIIFSLELTPPDLGASTCTPPTNNATWATRAAAFIAHVDSGHPGLVVAWEVWNEPDLTGSFCPGAGTNLAAYLPLYAAAAPAMIAQVVSDGQTALVGGPVLSSSTTASTWLANTTTGLLGNSGTAPSVQFVSYHSYIGGCTVSFAACFTALQDASTGQAARYAAVNTLVRAGSQPSASTTPILVTETANSATIGGTPDPVRNDPTNGPLWTTTSTIDWLNSATVPTSIYQYSAQNSASNTNFCLFGTPDQLCNQPPLLPYPQFYAYSLINAPVFLNLAAGGHLATSISPGSSTSGLQSTAFYTSTADVMLITNPTASPVSTGTITFNHAGYSGLVSAKAYLLNANNASNTLTIVGLTAIANGFTIASISVPANSVLAISLPGSGVIPTSL